MSDFPFPDRKSFPDQDGGNLANRGPDYPVHISAREWSEYYKMYAAHFGLYENIVFDTVVELVERDHQSENWLVHIAGEATPRPFDKVVLASGSETRPLYPDIQNLSRFEGQFMHSQAYKGWVMKSG